MSSFSASVRAIVAVVLRQGPRPGPLDLSKWFQDREEVMSILLIKPIWEEVHFLNGLLNRFDEMTFFYSRNLRFFIGEEGSDDPFNIRRSGFRIFEEAFKIINRSFGIDEEITGD